MTSDDAVYAALTASGIKGTKVGWPYNKVPPLPWFTYRHVKKGEFFADDGNFFKMQRYDVDLYQKEPSDTERDAFEEALATIGPYACVESWTQTETCWVTSYSVTYHPNQ